jgi:hypothetical protein
MKRTRGFGVFIKRRGLFGRSYQVIISDGQNDIVLNEGDIFTIETDKPMSKPVLEKFKES